MKKNLTLSSLFSTGLIALALSPAVYADAWSVSATPSITQGAYGNSTTRNSLSDIGVTVSADYLEQGGMTAGYSNTIVNRKNGLNSIDQNNMLLSGRMNFFTDALPGKVTARLDGYQVQNNQTDDTSKADVIAPQFSWLSRDNKLYLDVGYANSRYRNGLNITQYSPTIGFGLNDGYDWLQLRSYQISGNNPASTAGKSSTASFDAKWTHFFTPASVLMPASLTLSAVTGEKVYAVDMDAQSVANLADLSTGSATAALAWNVSKKTKVLLMAGQTQFRETNPSKDYNLAFGYLSLSTAW
jgi:hypothetical protein